MAKIPNYRKLRLDEVCRELAIPKNTVILFHVRPDGDAVGSSFALKLLLEAMGKRDDFFCVFGEAPSPRTGCGRSKLTVTAVTRRTQSFCARNWKKPANGQTCPNRSLKTLWQMPDLDKEK